jgi:hypothetical protein
VSSYYCAVFVVLGLLAAATRTQEWLALGAMVGSRAVNALPIAAENPDLRYTVQSIVVLLWGALVLGCLLRGPRAAPAVRPASPVSRTRRRRKIRS